MVEGKAPARCRARCTGAATGAAARRRPPLNAPPPPPPPLATATHSAAPLLASTMALSAGEAHVTGAQPAAAVRDDSDICSASSSAKLGAPMKVKPLPLPSKPSMRKARVVEEPHSGAASGALALVGSAGSSPVG